MQASLQVCFFYLQSEGYLLLNVSTKTVAWRRIFEAKPQLREITGDRKRESVYHLSSIGNDDGCTVGVTRVHFPQSSKLKCTHPRMENNSLSLSL